MLGIRLEAGRLSLSSDTDSLTEQFLALGMLHSDSQWSGALGLTPAAEEAGTSRAFTLSLGEELTLHWLNIRSRPIDIVAAINGGICRSHN